MASPKSSFSIVFFTLKPSVCVRCRDPVLGRWDPIERSLGLCVYADTPALLGVENWPFYWRVYGNAEPLGF